MGACSGERGFTLMELIIVLAMLAAFAAMAVPLAGRLEARGRERETERRLELVRAAMLGPRDTLDAGGRRLLAGYAGDLGGVPPLRRSAWNDLQQSWQWDGLAVLTPEQETAYWASGMGQPRNLWAPLPPLLPGGAPDPLAARWRGPYLHEPRDEFPANAEHLRWSDAAQIAALTEEAQRRAAEAASREIEMRQTAGRLADAWGRSLLFFYVRPGGPGEPAEVFQESATAQTTIHIVSEGADMRSSSNQPAFRLALPENRDNLVLTITPQERIDAARAAETEQLLQAVRQALVGPWGPVDRLGRPVFGGYVGDQGRWPDLFVWQGTPPAWQPAAVTTDPVHGAVYLGQPRGLWTRDTNGDGMLAVPPVPPDLPLPPDPAPPTGEVLLGFGWRGPYLPRPAGTDEAEVLRDAWGVPLQFRLSHADAADPPPEQTLTISSAGPDGTPETEDDLREVVPRRFDVRAPIPPVTLAGTVVNETTENRWLRVRLHASPALQPAVPELHMEPQLVREQGSGVNTWQFSLTVPRSSAGLRLLELVEYRYRYPDPIGPEWQFYRRRDWTMVFIGSGGTATAEREPLVLRARP